MTEIQAVSPGNIIERGKDWLHRGLVDRSRSKILTVLERNPGIWHTREHLMGGPVSGMLVDSYRGEALTTLLIDGLVRMARLDELSGGDHIYEEGPSSSMSMITHDYVRDRAKQKISAWCDRKYGQHVDVDDLDEQLDYAGIFDKWEEIARREGVVPRLSTPLYRRGELEEGQTTLSRST